MILVDFSNLAHRILFVSTMKTSPHILEYRGMFLHMLFNNLRNIKNTYSKTYGDIILCIDAKRSWRKDLYPEYKAHRAESRDKNAIDFNEFYKLVDETLTVIDECFPFKVIKADKAEGDDIIASLVQHRCQEKTLIVTEDKDMRQLRVFPNVDIYKPIQLTFDTSSLEDVNAFMIEHILIGDKVDNIPSIKKDTEFSANFIKYLKTKDIYTTDVRTFLRLSISNKLMEEYQVLDKKGNKDIYKPPLFGEVKAKEFSKELRDNLYKNKLYIRNFVRNRKLIHFKYIPKDIHENVLSCFDVKTCSFNPTKMIQFFTKNSLRILTENVQDFYMDSKTGNISSLVEFDEWFS